jgi:hypothetical protein
MNHEEAKDTKEEERREEERRMRRFSDEVEGLGYAVIGAAIEVHRVLGLVFWRGCIMRRWLRSFICVVYLINLNIW